MNGVSLFLMLLFAFAGWQHARHLEKKYGRSAFGWPDWVWGIVCALSLLIGIVLLAIAERGLRKQPAPSAYVPAYGGAPAYGAAPAYGSAPAMAPAPTVPSPAPVAPAPALPPAGWAPDPSGRHQLRWWDGSSWTSAVHTNGVTSSDG